MMRNPLPLAIAVAAACGTLPAAANAFDVSQCVVKPPRVPTIDQPEGQTFSMDPDRQPVTVQANRSVATAGDAAEFEGDVKLVQGERRVLAQNARVSQTEGVFAAEGGLLYHDNEITVSAENLRANMADEQARLNKAKYWLNGQQIHGEAKSMKINSDNTVLLKDATFSTCPEGDEDWMVEANEIAIDGNEEWGELWDAKIHLFDVPVFYVPYMTVPITDKRKSGFLFPSISTSTKNGVDVAVPYYWNIAPNLDATLTTQYMSDRGLFLAGEGRYLQPYGEGQLNLEWMGNDRLLEEEDNRYLVHYSHSGQLNNGWRLYGDLTKFSDDNYFNDFDSAVSKSTDNQILREGEASYFTQFWNFSATVQDIKVLGDNEQPFRVMPQLMFDYHRPAVAGPFDFSFNSELTRFQDKNSSSLHANRLHLEPTLTLPYRRPAASLVAEVKLMQTFYDQDTPSDELDDFVSRTLPQFRINGQVNFERDTHVGGQRFLQTLEPQFQYLYVPHEDQSDIGLYDTARLQEDYFGLFRDRRFSGLDRIADANQLTLGLSSRFLDEQNIERARFSVGQIHFFEDSRVSLGDEDTQITESSSVLAAEMELQASERWLVSSSVLYDTNSGDTTKSEVMLDYRVGPNRLVQLSHRYLPDLGVDETGEPIDISQMGVRGAWPLSDNWYAVGNYHRDINLHRTIESYVGLQYEDCCWAVRLAYHRELNTNYEDDDFSTGGPRDDFDSGISLVFTLKGLGSTEPLGVEDMLNDGLFNYRRHYYLRN